MITGMAMASKANKNVGYKNFMSVLSAPSNG